MCCWQVIEAGANALVAGSAVFGAKDYAEGMEDNLVTCLNGKPLDLCSKLTTCYHLLWNDPLQPLKVLKPAQGQ